jgi:hypothetical protein
MIKVSLTYKKKCILLALFSTALAYYLYAYTFRSTWGLYNECAALEIKKEALQDAPLRLQMLEENLRITELYMQNDSGIGNLQHALLEYISACCRQQNLVLREIPMSTQHEKDNYFIETCRLRVEGDFHPLLQMLYEVEKKYPGKTASVHFFTKKTYQDKIQSLSADLIFQHIKTKPYAP